MFKNSIFVYIYIFVLLKNNYDTWIQLSIIQSITMSVSPSICLKMKIDLGNRWTDCALLFWEYRHCDLVLSYFVGSGTILSYKK